MKVSELTQSAYNDSSSVKKLNIRFPEIDLILDSDQIYSESMILKESLIEGDNVEFIGCIASEFEIQVYGVSQDLKGLKIVASIVADDTEEIVIFNGIVDSAVKQTNKNYKKITAYDALYSCGNIDVANWYNALPFPITLKQLRDSFFAYVGMEQIEISLPNDGIAINKEYNPKSLQSMIIFKSICQINGAFGIVGRDGIFDYRFLADLRTKTGAFPGLTLFPGGLTYPGMLTNEGVNLNVNVSQIPYYKKVDYQEYSIKPVEKVTVRQSDSVAGASFGDGNNYIVQGNIFTLNKSDEELAVIAQNIHKKIAGIEFIPFESESGGYPYLECGLDGISCYVYDYEKSQEVDVYKKKNFYVFNRVLKGIQSLTDNYSVQGEEYQKEFITDLHSQLEQLKSNYQFEISTQIGAFIPNYTYTRDELDLILQNIFKVKSVTTAPTDPDTNTIYLIQGEVVVE